MTTTTSTNLLDLGMTELSDAIYDRETETVTYYDDATATYWRVDEDDVVELGRRVAEQRARHPSDRVEVYSLWCAETGGEELGDNRTPVDAGA